MFWAYCKCGHRGRYIYLVTELMASTRGARSPDLMSDVKGLGDLDLEPDGERLRVGTHHWVCICTSSSLSVFPKAL